MSAVDEDRTGAARTVVAGGRVCVPGAAPRPLDIVVEHGVVAALRPHRGPAGDDAERTVDASGLLVLPGLVNAHTHSYGQLARAPFADDRLEPWMPRAMAAWRGAGPEAVAVAARLTAADALRRGITTVVDHATLQPAALDAVVDAYERSGIRVLLALQVADLPFDRWVPSQLTGSDMVERLAAADPFGARGAEEQLELVARAVDRLDGHPRISLLVGPAAPERCSDRLLSGLASLVEQHQLSVHTHLLEVPSQRLWGDLVGRLDDHDLLGPTTTVAHAVHVDAVDLSRLARAGTGVVLNPVSNAALGCRTTAPAAAMRAAGVAMGVGTDGFNCGGGQDLLGSARAAMVLDRDRTDPGDWIAPGDAWRLATDGVTSALGQPLLGRIELGAPADLLLIDPDHAGWLDLDDPTTEAVLGGFGDGLRRVLVGGAPVPTPNPSVDLPAARRVAADLGADRRFAEHLHRELVPTLTELSHRSAALISPR